jgi:hypothetical protein
MSKLIRAYQSNKGGRGRLIKDQPIDLYPGSQIGAVRGCIYRLSGAAYCGCQGLHFEVVRGCIYRLSGAVYTGCQGLHIQAVRGCIYRLSGAAYTGCQGLHMQADRGEM